MRVVDEAIDSEVAGTTTGDRLEVHAWRDGEVVASDLLVGAWSMSWDAGRSVQGQGTFEFADPDGTLAPWSMADALAPGGSRLSCEYVFGASGLRVPMGVWRVRAAEPRETWVVSNLADGSVQQVPGGGSVTVQADEDATATMELDRLDAERVQSSTCVGEIARLLADICAVTAHPEVVDAPVPSGLVYEESRTQAVESLLAVIKATHRVTADGSLEIVPATGVGPVWTIDGGDGGVKVHLGRSLSDEGVYNAVVATGQTADGKPLIGRAYTTSGSLAWRGPFGRVPMFKQSVGTTASSVQADATSTLATLQRSGEVDLPVECLAHPGIQPHDLVTVVASTAAGEESLVGRVVGMSLRTATSDTGSTPAKSMSLTVRVPADRLEIIARRVRRG